MANKRALSLQKVAEKAGLGINSIYGWKKRDPSISRLSKVANVLDVSVDYLLGKTDNPSSDNTEEKKVDIEDEHVIMTYQGKPIPKEDMEIIKRLLRGK
ncbi:hypothetical protein FC24_GL000463 [Loigolactobacillus rennini DSM 20253]|uniref:HTH cro/C1-type domain-containing protein n=2 Tax=Loigolactobacillus rennini TaxID=238013 RepID=A0A0R2CNW4_9LACO|nr:hypothetical protein FC24_GL000463 [Loigolactobacillus rennini DSM 20253]